MEIEEARKVTMAMRGILEINDENREVIIDSGAASNVITTALMKEMELEIEEPSNFRCIMANGAKVASLGKTTVNIGINEELMLPVQVNVLKSENKELIIGNDTLREMNARIDYEKKVLEIRIDGEEIIEILVEYERDIKVESRVESERKSEQEYEEELESEYEEYDSENEAENQREVYTIFKWKDEDENKTKDQKEICEISREWSESDIHEKEK